MDPMDALSPHVLADLLRDGLQQGKQPYVTLISNSMAPLLWQGDEVRLGPTAASALRPGMIVLLAGDRHFLTHRYWRQETIGTQTVLYTRGDRPVTFDPPQPAELLVARITARRRGERELELDRGRGRRLNDHLAAVAAWEWRWLLRQPRRGLRLWRKPLWLWAKMITSIAAN